MDGTERDQTVQMESCGRDGERSDDPAAGGPVEGTEEVR